MFIGRRYLIIFLFFFLEPVTNITPSNPAAALLMNLFPLYSKCGAAASQTAPSLMYRILTGNKNLLFCKIR